MKARLVGKILALSVLASGLSLSARAQVCGYSVATIYLNDADGRPIENAKIEFSDKDSGADSAEHFKVYTKTRRDAQRKAYVAQHGLCGEHRDAVLRVSAAGFEIAERVIELTFGRQGFVFKLRRKGAEEKGGFEKLSCAEQSSRCAGFSEENDGGTR